MKHARKSRTIGGPTSQDSCDDFNRRFPIGTPVWYFNMLPFGPKVDTKIRVEAFLDNAGQAVCFVEGVSGYVSIWHIKEMLVD